MDADKHHQGQEQGQVQHQEIATQVPESSKETTSASTYKTSLVSRDSSLGLGTDGDLSDMDGDGYRRRRAQVMASLENGGAGVKRSGRKHARRKGPAAPGEEHKHRAYSSDDGHGSDFSSVSTSDDVELSHLASDDALSDDEETGLTKKDKEHRKRTRRKNTRLDGRIAGNIHSAQQDQKEADRTVMRSMIINILLIGSWYLFSLSISIVSEHMRPSANLC
jgi:solute carrier family 35 protein C2